MQKLLAVSTLLALTACAGAGDPTVRPSPATGTYDAWVTSESADRVTLVRYGPEGASIVESLPVGMMPVEIDGPHGVAVAPDGRFIYVTIGHGVPFGYLWKIDAETHEVVGRTTLGRFPATVSVTPDGEYGFVSNFNLHGDPVPSSISKVHLGTMAEVARTETCVMPHGSRVNPQGTRHYSVCMMDQLLVELDVGTGSINRLFSVAPGHRGPVDPGAAGAAAGHGQATGDEVCSPTWAEPSADGSSVFVTCNRAAEVLQIDADRWELVRRIPTGEAPYNLATTPDGRYLLVSLRNRTDPALEVYDVRTGEQVARVPATTTLVHGIAVSGDSRIAFISVEGVGSEPGKVDVIDLSTFSRAASVEVGQQATGIATVP